MNTINPTCKSADLVLLAQVREVLVILGKAIEPRLYPTRPGVQTQLEAICDSNDRLINLLAELEYMVQLVQKTCEHNFEPCEADELGVTSKFCSKCKLVIVRPKAENLVRCDKCGAPMKDEGIHEAAGARFRKHKCTKCPHDVMTLE